MLILELSAFVLEIPNNYYMLISHWLFITRSRLMQADWLNQDNNAVANLHTYLPYCSTIVIYLSFFLIYILYLHRNRRSDRIDYESSFPSATQPASRSSSNNSSRNKFSHIETVSVKAEENICELPAFIPYTKKT